MTQGGGFDYGPGGESIVARVSVDIPAEGVSTLRDLTSETQRFRVEMEAAARAEGDFLNYLQQLPQIQNQVITLQRNLVAELERTIDVQKRMAQPGGPGGVPSGPVEPPLQTMAAGQGGRPPSAADVNQQLGQLDARTLESLNAARGQTRPGQMPPSQTADEVSAEDDARKSARADAISEQQAKNPPADKSSGFDKFHQGLGVANQIINEMGSGGNWASTLSAAGRGIQGAGRLAKLLGAARGAGAGATAAEAGAGAGQAGLVADEAGVAAGAPVGAAAAGGAEAAGGAGLLGMIGKAGPIGAAIAAAGAGLFAFEKGGNVVEGWRQMGQVRGGGWEQGLGYEAQVRTMALNPFLTTEQARKIVQGALSEGYTGKEYDSVVGFVADNLKGMNMEVSDSFQVLRRNMAAGGATMGDIKGQLGEIPGLSKTGYRTETERLKDYAQLSDVFTRGGIPGAQAGQFAIQASDMYSGDLALKDVGPGLAKMTGSPTAQMWAARMAGVNLPPGTLPNMVGRAEARQGLNPATVMESALRTYAQRAAQESPDDHDRAVGIFMMMVAAVPGAAESLGIDVNDVDSMDRFMMSLLTSNEGQASAQRTAPKTPVPRQQQVPQGGEKGTLMSGGNMRQAVSAFTGGKQAVAEDGSTQPLSGVAARQAVLNGQNWRYPGDQTGGQGAPNVTHNYYGGGSGGVQVAPVQGTLTIQVNPNEFQKALGVPQQVPLSTNEVQANAGWGTAQRNYPPPGQK